MKALRLAAQVLRVGSSFSLLALPLLSVIESGQPTPGRRGPAPSAMFIALGAAPDAVRLTSPDAGVAFDIDGDGDLDQVAWTESGTTVALFAIDANSDGRITSGTELIGSQMVAGAGNGPNALLQLFEKSGAALSGAVQQGHTLYEQIVLWIDGNHDGLSEPNELRLAKELFTGVGLGFVTENRQDEHGNRFRFKGWVELRTGGPEQGRATGLSDHQRRLRHYYEAVLTIR
jgi:hypothetical protein